MKKILITMLIALTMCLFLAFSVSAEEYELVDNLGDPDWYTGNYQLMKDKTSKVVLDNGDGTYTAYPAYYILKYYISLKDGAISEAYINGFDYSFVNGKTGRSYDLGAIYKIELPNGLTTIKDSYFGYHPKEANVVELIMPDSITSVAAHAFRNDKSSTKINLKRIVFSKNLTYIGPCAFINVTTLETVEFPAGTDAVLDLSSQELFKGCSNLQSVDLSKRNVERIGSSCFNGCSSLGKVTLPDTITHFDSQCFYYCEKMYFASDFLPKNLKVAGFHFLSGCKNINDVLYFPDGFESFGSECFDTSKGNPGSIVLVFLGKMTGTITLNKLAPRDVNVTLIFTKNTFDDLNSAYVTSYQNGDTIGFIGKTADGNNYKKNGEGTLSLVLGNPADMNSKIKDDNGNISYYVNTNKCNNIYFCGGDTVEYCRDVRTSQPTDGKSVANYITSPYVFDRQAHIDGGVHYDLTEVLSLANCGIDGVTEHTCVLCSRVEKDVIPATGDHTVYEVSPCADKCEVCLLYVQKATQNHAIVEYFVYENGYMNEGVYGEKCTNEGCICKTEEVKAELVCDLGYAVPEFDGVVGITYGYKANKDVLGEYERVNGCKAELGVLIATGENFQKDEKIFEFKFFAILDCVEVIVNYGDRTDLNDCELVIAAVLYQTKDGETVKTCLQGATDKAVTNYTSATYGTLYGVSLGSLKN